MTKNQLIEVGWDDAEDPPEGKAWLDEAEVEEFSTQTTLVKSCGYLVSKTDKYLTVAGDYIEKLEHRSRVTKIPVGAIVTIREIGEG